MEAQSEEQTDPAYELKCSMATILGVLPAEVVGVQATEYLVAVAPEGETGGVWHRVKVIDGRYQ